MTEDDFKRILEENNAKLFGQVVKHFDERVDMLDNKLTGRFDSLDKTLDGLAKRIDDDD